jgi:hypothetical protein
MIVCGSGFPAAKGRGKMPPSQVPPKIEVQDKKFPPALICIVSLGPLSYGLKEFGKIPGRKKWQKPQHKI